MTDEELFDDKSPEAFVLLRSRYKGVLSKFVQERLHNASDTEDVVAATLSLLWLKPDFRLKGEAKGILLAIAARKCYEVLRYRVRQQKLGQLIDPTIQPSHESTVPPMIGRALQHGVNQLPETEQTVTRLWMEGADEQQIAETMESSQSVVRKLLASAFEKLRNIFRQ